MSNVSAIVPADGYLSQAQEWERRATSVQVVDQESYDAAATLLQGIQALIKEAEAHHDPIIALANKTHKAALAARAKVTGPLAGALGIIKRKTSLWLDAQEQIRQAAERRLKAEAERVKKEQEALAAQELERQRTEAKQAQEAIARAAQAQGVPDEDIQALIETSESGPDYSPIGNPQTVEDLRRSILFERETIAAPTFVKNAGATLVYNYTVEVHDLPMLIDAGNCVPEVFSKYLMPNLQLLNAEAKALKDDFDPPPGCKLVKTPTTRTTQGYGQ